VISRWKHTPRPVPAVEARDAQIGDRRRVPRLPLRGSAEVKEGGFVVLALQRQPPELGVSAGKQRIDLKRALESALRRCGVAPGERVQALGQRALRGGGKLMALPPPDPAGEDQHGQEQAQPAPVRFRARGEHLPKRLSRHCSTARADEAVRQSFCAPGCATCWVPVLCTGSPVERQATGGLWVGAPFEVGPVVELE